MSFAHSELFGTDSGEPCPRCACTIVTYTVFTWNEINETDAELHVRCVGCHLYRIGYVSYRENYMLRDVHDIKDVAKRTRLVETRRGAA